MAQLTENDFEDVVRVNLKGAYAPPARRSSWWLSDDGSYARRTPRMVITTSGTRTIGQSRPDSLLRRGNLCAAMTWIATVERAGTGIGIGIIVHAAPTAMSGDGTGSALAQFMRVPGDPAAFSRGMHATSYPPWRVWYCRAAEVVPGTAG